MAKHKKKDKSDKEKRVTQEYSDQASLLVKEGKRRSKISLKDENAKQEYFDQASLLVKEENRRSKISLKDENAKEVRDSEDELQIVDEVCNTSFKMSNIKKEKDEEENHLEKSGPKTVTENSAASSSENPNQKVKKRRSRSSSSSSASESSSSETSSSDESSSSSFTSSTSSSSEKNKRKKKALKRSSKRSKSSRKAKKPKHKSKKISSNEKSDSAASPNLYAEYNKVAGQPMGKKERKVLQETSTGFKPYPKTSELTKKKEETVGRKGKKRSFFCLPHALSDSVPPFREWTRLIGYGVGQKLIQVNNDATSEELVGSLYKEFPALNGIQFSYAKARNGIFKEDDIIDNSANMATLKSAIGSAGDIFIIPHRDLLLPTDPVGIRVKCPDCGENILSCDSREHSATHLRDDNFFCPERAKITYERKKVNKDADGQKDGD